MNEITSVNNLIIKDTAALSLKKNREETGLFLIEGAKCVEEAIKNNLEIERIFILNGKEEKISGIEPQKVFLVTEAVMKKISTTQTPTYIIAVAKHTRFALEDILNKKNPLILILEGIKDAGNLGTIIRTAIACNADGIVLYGDTIDIFNPKVVRSSVGNLWKIPIIKKDNIDELIGTRNFQFLASVVKQDKTVEMFYDIDYNKPTIIMLGSESEGISEELKNKATNLFTIPMNSQVESLNLSVAAGIILYESFLQRQHHR